MEIVLRCHSVPPLTSLQNRTKNRLCPFQRPFDDIFFEENWQPPRDVSEGTSNHGNVAIKLITPVYLGRDAGFPESFVSQPASLSASSAGLPDRIIYIPKSKIFIPLKEEIHTVVFTVATLTAPCV